MTYKQIEAAREMRMWIGQIVVPLVTVMAAVPEIREPIVKKFKESTSKFARRKEEVVYYDKEGKPIKGRFTWGK